ncbi:MAG: hypothetical protein ACI8YI_002916 [Paracoccaceae bacterium]|jgi:hypothetical protein
MNRMRNPQLKILKHSLAWLLVVSTIAGVTIAQSARSHELRPAIADIEILADQVTLKLVLVLEPVLAGIDLDGLTDTDASPLASKHDELRALTPELLERQLRAIWPDLRKSILLKAGTTNLTLIIDKIDIPNVGNIHLPRDSQLFLLAELPAGNSTVTLNWGKELGLLALRQLGSSATYEAMLSGGDTSAELPRMGTLPTSFSSFLVQYIKIGVQHIVPKGFDHVLFVLGLFLFSAAFRPLIWQITTFTLAHTLTLGLAALGLITVPSAIVEPLIAASITYIAVENITGGKLTRRRLVIIFGFGLLHGLGFASVLAEISLQPAHFVVGLIGFNVGVEIGQLAVIVCAFMTVGIWFRNRPYYRKVITIPASILIGAIGAYWFVTRTFF